MSTRSLKKLQCQKVPDDCPVATVDESSECVQPAVQKTKPLNRYDLLKDFQTESDNEDGGGEPVDDEDDPDEAFTVAEPAAAKNKKKRRRKNQKTNVKSNESVAGGKTAGSRTSVSMSKSSGKVAAAALVPEPAENAKMTARDKKLSYLKIIEKHLNYENEKERKFKTQTKTVHQKNQLKPKSNLKKQPILVPVKLNWARNNITVGLSMDLVASSKTRSNTFKFVHSQAYQKCQHEFLRGVEKMDVGIIQAILYRNPFHIDSIIQLSEYCKLNEDLAFSVELVERGLHFMEHVLHPMFSLTKSNCSLPYKYRENRSFFILLFKHVLNVSRRSLYRTALELAKLILSLDMTDPLAVILFLDYFAIRCGEYKWLLEFFDAYDEEKKLSQLPSFAFSVAIAHYRLGNKAQASDHLMKAIVQYPQTVFRLFEKCNYDINKCLHQVHIFKNDISCPKSLTNLIDLYVHRNVSVWRDNRNQLLIWLESVLLANFDDLKSLLPETARYVGLYKDLNVTYKGNPRTVLRHLIVADVKEMAPIYFEYGGQMHFFDPLPPNDSIDIYSRTNTRTESQIVSTSSVSLLIQSLSPSFNWRNLDSTMLVNREGEQHQRLLDDIRRVLGAVRSLVWNFNGLGSTGSDVADNVTYSESSSDDEYDEYYDDDDMEEYTGDTDTDEDLGNVVPKDDELEEAELNSSSPNGAGDDSDEGNDGHVQTNAHHSDSSRRLEHEHE